MKFELNSMYNSSGYTSRL